MKRTYRPRELTEKMIRYIVKNWDIMSNQELAEQLDTNPATISALAGLVRKGGLVLPRHSRARKPIMTPEFVEELKKIYKHK